MDTGFIPQHVRDGLTIFAVVVSMVTLWQAFRIRSALSRIGQLSRPKIDRDAFALVVSAVATACFATLVVIWIAWSVTKFFIPDDAAVVAVGFGAIAASVLGGLMADGVRLFSRGKVPIFLHITVIATTIASTFSLGILVWPDLTNLWVLQATQLTAAGIVMGPALVVYVLASLRRNHTEGEQDDANQ